MMSTPAPGTAAYFPSILARIHEACPELPVDPVIVQSLLLCLVATDEGSTPHNGKNLILRTRDEDIGLVLNLTELVSVALRTLMFLSICTIGPRQFISRGPAEQSAIVYAIAFSAKLWVSGNRPGRT